MDAFWMHNSTRIRIWRPPFGCCRPTPGAPVGRPPVIPGVRSEEKLLRRASRSIRLEGFWQVVGFPIFPLSAELGRRSLNSTLSGCPTAIESAIRRPLFGPLLDAQQHWNLRSGRLIGRPVDRPTGRSVGRLIGLTGRPGGRLIGRPADLPTGRLVDRSTGRPADRVRVIGLTGRPADRPTGRPAPVDRPTGRPADRRAISLHLYVHLHQHSPVHLYVHLHLSL